MENPLKAWREAQNKLVSEAAKLGGITPGTWSKYENGRLRISGERCVDLERRLGIPREDLRPDLFSRETAQ